MRRPKSLTTRFLSLTLARILTNPLAPMQTIELSLKTQASKMQRWPLAAVEALFALPMNDLLHRAHEIHRQHHDPNAVQLSTLLSIKTGGCPEDCGYCTQSAHYDTGVKATKLMDVEDVLAEAARGQGRGRHALLHGRRLARAQGPRSRAGAARWSRA